MTTEWRHVFERFHRFIESLRPTASERRAARDAAARVAHYLRGHFRPLDAVLADGFPGAREIDYLVIGGYAKGTAIRPAPTVDVLYVLPSNLRRHTGAGAKERSLGPTMTAILGQRFTDVCSAREGWLAIMPDLSAAAGQPAVRVIPCFPMQPRGDSQGYPIADPWAAGTWHHVNPRAEVARLSEADAASGDKASHLILMLKAWRRAHDVPIRALALELLVIEFVSIWTYHRRSLLFYDWMVRDFFFWLRYQEGRELEIPGSVDRLDLDDVWSDAAGAAYAAATEACRLERDSPDGGALALWGNIFGTAFIAAQSVDASRPTSWLRAPGRLPPGAMAG